MILQAIQSGNPGAKRVAQLVNSDRLRRVPKSKLRRCDEVGLGEAFGRTDTDGGALVFLISAGGQPHVECEHLRVHAATRQVVYSLQGVHLVRVIEHSHARKRLWLAAYAELYRQERRTGASEGFLCRPLDEGVAKDDRAISGQVESPHKLADGRICGHFGRTPRKHIDIA